MAASRMREDVQVYTDNIEQPRSYGEDIRQDRCADGGPLCDLPAPIRYTDSVRSSGCEGLA
jgi:hypothetical protein